MEGGTAQKDKESDSKSIALVDALHKAIIEQTNNKEKEKKDLKEITQNQLKNIRELQKKCEESFIAIKQLPENRRAAEARYNEVLSEVSILQAKQFELNELLNLSMKEFDETIILINRAREMFKSEVDLANERCFVYKADCKDIRTLGDDKLQSIKRNLSSKSQILEEFKVFVNELKFEEAYTKLGTVKKQINDLEIRISELEQVLHKTEEDLAAARNKTLAFETEMEAHFQSLTQVLENLQIKSEEQKKLLEEVMEEINVIIKNFDIKSLEYECLKKKVEEECEKANAISTDVEDRKKELEHIKSQYEELCVQTSALKDVVSHLNQIKDNIAASDGLISQLQERKNEIVEEETLLIQTLHSLNEAKSTAETELNDNNTKLILLKETTEARIRQKEEKEEEYNILMKKMEEESNSLCRSISDLQTSSNQLLEALDEKNKMLDELNSSLSLLKETYQDKLNVLNERKETNQIRHKNLCIEEMNTKLAALSDELEKKKEEMLEKQKLKETVCNLTNQIKESKDSYSELITSFKKEKEEVNEACSRRVEDKLNEMQKDKANKEKTLENVRDEASKAEFTYYRLKSQTQRLRGELNCVKEIFKSYECENELLVMLLNWLDTDVQGSVAGSDHPPSATDTDDTFSLKGDPKIGLENKGDSDSSFDDTEEMPAAELPAQDYRRPKTLKDMIDNKKRTLGIPKKDERPPMARANNTQTSNPIQIFQKRAMPVQRRKLKKKQKEKPALAWVLNSSSSP